MRVVADIPHPDCKITIFYWNSKYLIKLEKGMLEQTYKVSELDVTGEDDIRKLLDQGFLQAVIQRFEEMEVSWYEAISRV